MNNKRATKRALLTSVMALVMCVVMLVGTTFAWFTDTASTGVNKIQAGNLDVDIIGEDGKSLDGKSLSFVKAGLTTDTGAEIDPNATTEILWEPGCRYVTEGFRIANKGNLALKWKAVVNKGATAANEGNFDLLDVIDFYLVTSKDVNEVGTELNEFSDKLAAKTNSGVYYIKGVMKTTAGNDYQGLTLDGITITVYATQDTVEYDSFGPDYDKNATYYPVIDFVGLKDALGKGGNITIAGDFTGDATKTAAGDRLTIKTPTTLNFEGVYTVPGSLEASENWAALYITDATTINAIDGAGIICEDKTDSSAAYIGGPYVAHINAPGKTVTVNGGTYYGGCTTFNVQKGTLIVNGGFFQVTPDNGTNDCRYTLNCIDANYKDGSANIIVTGGTFVNFNPADCKAEGEHTNFVAEGYSVISETKANGDIWYTVVKGTGVTAGTQEALKDALTRADTTGSNALTVKLADGEYTLYNVDRAKTQNTELTIEGAGKDKTTMSAYNPEPAAGEANADYSYENSDVTFKNITVNLGTGDWRGIVRAKSLYFENCIIEGRGSYWGTGTVVFKNCTFASVESDYNMWAYAGMDFTFENCTFNSDAGKFINAYKTQHTNTTKLTFTDCKFVAGTENKPAVCLKGYESNAWDVTFSGCSLTNCKTDATTGSNYYLLDQGIENATTVTIDGSVVWANGSKIQ